MTQPAQWENSLTRLFPNQKGDWARQSMLPPFSCTLFDRESTVEWYRPRISTRNVASVFPDRPRYILIDTSAGNVMIVPERDGFFTDLEHGHIYLVPEVRPATETSLNSPPSAAALAAAEKAAAAAAAMNTPPAIRTEGSSVGKDSPQPGRSTLKGFNFKDAKEKMKRKKTMGREDAAAAKANHRKSSGISITQDASRRRSSSSAEKFMSWKNGNDDEQSDNLSSSGSAFPGIKLHVDDVTVQVTKDTMAMGPLSPDVMAGETFTVQRVDSADGNVEVLIREKPHLIRLDCVHVIMPENPTRDQRAMQADIQQAIKDRKKMTGGGSFRRSSTAQRSVLTQIRGRLGRSDQASPSDTNSLSPRSGGSLASSAGSSAGSYMPPGIDDEPADEKLNPSSVYGKPLGMNEMPIPGPVRKCVEYFRRADHIKYEGIFRVPGSSNAVMRIRNKFLVADSTDYNIPDDENPTVVASALKTFLFELPEPLIPVSLWYKLLEITDNRDFELADAHELLDEIPDDHYEVLRYIFEFLADVAEYAQDNKMTPPNLGMVFGIVLLQPPDQNVSNVGSSMPKEVCTFFVEHVDEIFEEEESTE